MFRAIEDFPDANATRLSLRNMSRICRKVDDWWLAGGSNMAAIPPDLHPDVRTAEVENKRSSGGNALNNDV